MAKLKKLILTETKRDVSTNLNTQLPDKDSLEKQLEKFSTSYSSTKLDNLYDEYNKVDLTTQQIEENSTAVKASHMSFKKGLAFGTIFVVTVLFLFLCIYNIVVINQYSSRIDMLQRDVAITSTNLNDVQASLDEQLNSAQLDSQLQESGYTKSSTTKKVPRLQKNTSQESSGPSNWFDKFCNFVSKLFGKN